jgi:hypothetical protein
MERSRLKLCLQESSFGEKCEPFLYLITFGVHLVKYLGYFGQGSSSCLPLAGGNMQILRQHILSLINLTLFGNGKTPAASQKATFVITLKGHGNEADFLGFLQK